MYQTAHNFSSGCWYGLKLSIFARILNVYALKNVDESLTFTVSLVNICVDS